MIDRISAHHTRRRWLTGLALLVVMAAAQGRAQGPAVPALFGPAAAGARVPAVVGARLDTLQARPVMVRDAALAAESIDIELTGGRVVRAVLDRREAHRNGAQTWSGHVPGEPLSTVTLVSNNGVLQGSVRLLDGAYSIEPAAGGPLHLVREVDTSATGGDIEPVLPPVTDPAVANDTPPMAGDDGSTFDVLVMYTQDARTAAGGTDVAAQTRIALGVSETNTAYANSGITPRLRLVGAEATTYTESGDLGVDLGRFRTNGDGYMDEVFARRDALGADLVVLVVGNAAGGACGVGYVMTSLSAGFASSAFSVTAYPCISPNYTFAHELGHNMGSAHAPEDGAGQASLYPYSFGYKHPSNLFRTVMAYNCPVNCPRVLHFSNPNVNYAGNPTGTAVQHDNVRSINSAASTIANWRQAVGGGTAPTITALSNVTINEDAATSPLAFTVSDAETAASSLTVTASSSNTALVPNTGAALALGGSGSSRTLVVTPTANASGTSTITVTVSDGALTATRSFVLTVTAVNDVPTVVRTPASATIANGLSAHATVTVSDVDTAGASLTLTGASSNTTVLPNASIVVTATATTATSRTFDVAMTPAPGQSGLVTVTLTGSDGVASVPTTVLLTVTIPVPPTIGAIAAQSTAEDTPITVPFTIDDLDTPNGALVVQAVSSNQTLVPAANLVLGGTGTARSLTITPAANASGTATITVSVNDGLATAQSAFVLTVTAVDDPPSFAPGVPLAISTVVDTSTSFPVTITDPDTAGASLTLTATSSNALVLATGGITIAPVSSTATSRTFDVTVSPLAAATGVANVALLAHDATSAVGRAVPLTVTATPAAPDAPTSLIAGVNGLTLTLTWTAPTTGSTPTSYAVEVGNAPGATTLPVQNTSSTSLGIALPTGGTYYARVHAVNTHGTSVASPEVLVTVATPNPVPGAPRNLGGSFSGRTVFLSWASPVTGDPVTNYVLEVGNAPGLSNLVVVPVGAATSFLAGGVPDGTYWLRVRGSNGAGTGAASEDLALVVGPAGGCVGLPLAPTFHAPVVSGANFTLSWDAPASGVAPLGYVLFAGSAPGRSDIATVDLGGATSFSAAAPSGAYVLRVAARGACGVGAASNEVTMLVGSTSVVPVQPTGLTASTSGGLATLQWTAPTTGAVPTSYVVEVGTISGGVNVSVFNTGSAATTISGPVPPGRYFIRVRSKAGTLVSPPSNEAVLVVP